MRTIYLFIYSIFIYLFIQFLPRPPRQRLLGAIVEVSTVDCHGMTYTVGIDTDVAIYSVEVCNKAEYYRNVLFFSFFADYPVSHRFYCQRDRNHRKVSL